MDITKKASMGGYIGQKENRQNWVDTEQAFPIKLRRTERERLIAAIKVRQSILRIGDTQQMGTSREKQINTAQQIRHEAKAITQNISTEMTGSPIRALVVRILRKLPEKAYKYLSATVILSMALSLVLRLTAAKNSKLAKLNRRLPLRQCLILYLMMIQ